MKYFHNVAAYVLKLDCCRVSYFLNREKNAQLEPQALNACLVRAEKKRFAASHTTCVYLVPPSGMSVYHRQKYNYRIDLPSDSHSQNNNWSTNPEFGSFHGLFLTISFIRLLFIGARARVLSHWSPRQQMDAHCKKRRAKQFRWQHLCPLFNRRVINT